MINNKNYKDSKILIVGDLILDKYWFGKADRISPEAPVPIVKIDKTEERLGAAGNVAKNISSLGGNACIMSILGKDKDSFKIKKLLKKNNILSNIHSTSNFSTISKIRVLSGNNQVIRIDYEKDNKIIKMKNFLRDYKKKIKEVSTVVFSDYNKGVLYDIPRLIAEALKQKKIVITDPKGNSFDKYKGSTIITPNLSEFESVVGKCLNKKQIEVKARDLIKKFNFKAILVTQGKEGMTLIRKKHKTLKINALTQEVFDVSGAGDTVVAVLSLFINYGYNLTEAVKIANIAAGLVVKKIGTSSIDFVELNSAIISRKNLLGDNSIIKNLDHIKKIVKKLQKKNKKIVMTNGCFDILHPGHLHLLSKSKILGDYLIVAVNSDVSIKRLKGKGRPINNLMIRMRMLTALKYVDFVVSFDEDTPENLYKNICPDILTKGSDYKNKKIVGEKEVLKNGGKVILINHLNGFSTTKLIHKYDK